MPRMRRRLLDMLSAGKTSRLVDATEFRGLESVADAQGHLLAGANIGKVIADLRWQKHARLIKTLKMSSTDSNASLHGGATR